MSSTCTAVVFGGGGFIGTHLIRSLKAQGAYSEIIAADIKLPEYDQEEDVRYAYCDVREPITLMPSGATVDIYNLAAVHTTPGHADWEYFWTNLRGAQQVCTFAKKVNAARMLFTSSISTFGPTEGPRDEQGPFAPDSAYGMSKLLAEGTHRDWQVAEPGRRLVVVRPAVIFGAGEHGNFTRLAGMLKRRAFFYPGRKDTIKSCGYVKDLVRSMHFVMAQSLADVTYNFAYPERYTSEQICEAFHKVAGYARPTIVLPLGVMRAAAGGFEILAKLGFKTSINRGRVMKLVRSTNVVPVKLQELGFSFDCTLEQAIADWWADVKHGDFA